MARGGIIRVYDKIIEKGIKEIYMKPPDLEWYTVKQLSRKWNLDEDDIQHFIDSGKLKQSKRVKDRSGYAWWIEDEPNRASEYENPGMELKLFLYIRSQEVERFQKQHDQGPQLKKLENKEGCLENGNNHEPQSKMPDYLNKDHPHYSKELHAAVKAWVYAVEMDPDPKIFKKIVKEYLRIKRFKVGEIERIATVVNPHKASGAPKKDLSIILCK
jgi:hypothetical protein